MIKGNGRYDYRLRDRALDVDNFGQASLAPSRKSPEWADIEYDVSIGRTDSALYVCILGASFL